MRKTETAGKTGARLSGARWTVPALLGGASLLSPALAQAAPILDIYGVQSAAQELPSVYGLLRRPGDTSGGPMDINSTPDNAFQAYLDTGTSGIILSQEYADPTALDVQTETTSTGATVTFSDIAVNGTTDYNVSEKLNLQIAPYTGLSVDTSTFTSADTNAYFNQVTNNIRIQLTQQPVDPLLGEPLNLIGMPAMLGKVMVVDARLYNHLVNIDPSTLAVTYDDQLSKLADWPTDSSNVPYPQLQTWLYNTADSTGHSATPMFDPGIPKADHIVKLSYGDFSKFTVTTPTGSGIEPPVLAHNPFIGPAPFGASSSTTPPGITLSRTLTGTSTLVTTTGSWLLDTGAQVSFMSSAEALALGVELTTDTSGNPELIDLATGLAPAGEFSVDLGGAGGDAGTMLGFTVDELDLPTTTGIIAFHDVPIGVLDITVSDGTTTYTLDGDFGMNLLLPSMDTNADNATSGQFDFITFDEAAGELRLTDTTAVAVPEPACLLGIVLLTPLIGRRRRLNPINKGTGTILFGPLLA